MFVCPECGAAEATGGHCGADGTLLAPVGEDILLGQSVGAYRVSRLLGVGGMGRVYKGVQPQIGSRVAIKVLSRECSDRKDLVDRFFSEARAVNLIRHESIVNVLDLAMLPDGRPYIIMEYLDGAPLASIVEAIPTRGPLPLGGLARLAVEVLDALGAAHAKGIVHRDLKPDNIFVTPAGRPKVLDFGIAKLLPELGGSYTQTGSLLGTPHYMAPEQAAGRQIDYRADLYAMGVILFECSTGQKPFYGESLFDLLRKHVDAPPPLPRSLRPDLAPAFEQVILTALAKAPDQRFASAHAMSLALQQATAQLPPDQWAPISGATGTGASRVPSGAGWSGTPPPTWSSPPPVHAPTQPSPTPAHVTVSGQVGAAPSGATLPKKSRSGLLIGLVAVVVVGGGITAAVIASGGGGGGGGTTVANGSGSATTQVAIAPTPTPTPVAPKLVAAPPTPVAPVAPAGGGSAAAPAKPPAEIAADDPDQITDVAFQQYASQIEGLPAKTIKQLNKHGDLHKRLVAISKLPSDARTKALEVLQHDLVQAAQDATTAVDPDDDQPTPGVWVKYHKVPPPAGYDPKHVDVDAFLPWAIAEGKRYFPDAQLIRIDEEGVYPDGHADLTIVENGSIDVRFIVPSRSKRDPKVPLGVEPKWQCEFRVMAQPDGVIVSPIDGWACNEEQVLPLPHCSAARVWKKAIAMKAPSGNAVGQLGYRSPGKGEPGRWYFEVASAFSEMIDDNCR